MIGKKINGIGIGDWRFEKKMPSNSFSVRWINLNEQKWISFGERSGDWAKRSTTQNIAVFWNSKSKYPIKISHCHPHPHRHISIAKHYTGTEYDWA